MFLKNGCEFATLLCLKSSIFAADFGNGIRCIGFYKGKQVRKRYKKTIR